MKRIKKMKKISPTGNNEEHVLCEISNSSTNHSRIANPLFNMLRDYLVLLEKPLYLVGFLPLVCVPGSPFRRRGGKNMTPLSSSYFISIHEKSDCISAHRSTDKIKPYAMENYCERWLFPPHLFLLFVFWANINTVPSSSFRGLLSPRYRTQGSPPA